MLDGAEYLASVMNKVPAMILPCIEGRLTNSSPALASPFYGSILLAVWSLQLALRSRGLGSCFTTLSAGGTLRRRRAHQPAIGSIRVPGAVARDNCSSMSMYFLVITGQA